METVGGMDILARPMFPSITPISVSRPFLLALDEFDDEESNECEVVLDLRGGKATSWDGSNAVAGESGMHDSSEVALPL